MGLLSRYTIGTPLNTENSDIATLPAHRDPLETEGLSVLNRKLGLRRREISECPHCTEAVIQHDEKILARARIPAQPAIDSRRT